MMLLLLILTVKLLLHHLIGLHFALRQNIEQLNRSQLLVM